MEGMSQLEKEVYSFVKNNVLVYENSDEKLFAAYYNIKDKLTVINYKHRLSIDNFRKWERENRTRPSLRDQNK